MKRHLAVMMGAVAALAMVLATGADAKPRKRKAAAPPPAEASTSVADLNRAQLQRLSPPPAAAPPVAPPSAPTTVPPPTVTAQAVAVPEAMILIRSSLSALQQANDTSDYNVLCALGSKGFQAANPPAVLGEAFAPLKPYNINSVLVLEPQFTQPPVLTDKGLIVAAGYFLNDGFRITFDLAFVAEDERWKLFTLSAGLQQVAPPPA